MRVSREKALENREQIIETAARLLREHGFDGIGVADIMKAAGLLMAASIATFLQRMTWRSRPANVRSRIRQRC